MKSDQDDDGSALLPASKYTVFPPASPSTTFAAPRHFSFTDARYRYVRLLGHGAYGLVAAAIDRQNGQAVALKRINQLNSLLVARRTLRELKLLRHFRGHPNVPPRL